MSAPYRDLLSQIRLAFPQPVSDRIHDSYFVFSLMRAIDQIDALKSEIPLLGGSRTLDYAAARQARMASDPSSVEQVTEELAFERSGPERYLSCFVLLTRLIDVIGKDASPATKARIGAQIAWVATLRNMSLSIAGKLNQGEDPALAASIVKDLGCQFEQGLPGLAQELCELEPTLAGHGVDYQQVLGNLIQLAPSFSLRGGTPEIMRGIIAKGLGVR